jgi:hypothetical protein
LAATHGRLVDFVQSAPEHQLIGDTRFRHRLRIDTYSHYPLHAEAIRQWRQRISVNEFHLTFSLVAASTG